MPPAAELEQQLMADYQAQGVPPEVAAPQIQQELARVAETGVEYDAWLLEADYTIEAGSTRRQDINQQIDASNEFMRQALPVLMGPAQANPQVMAAAMNGIMVWAKINGMPADFVDTLAAAQQAVMMPPPMPAPAVPGAPPTPDGPVQV